MWPVNVPFSLVEEGSLCVGNTRWSWGFSQSCFSQSVRNVRSCSFIPHNVLQSFFFFLFLELTFDLGFFLLSKKGFKMADLMTYCKIILSDHHQKKETAREKRCTILQSNLKATCKLNTKYLPYNSSFHQKSLNLTNVCKTLPTNNAIIYLNLFSLHLNGGGSGKWCWEE